MASPQKENGFTPVANEIVEALARTRINGEAMQVLWVILRKTYGYQKKEDAIALSQFVEFTGLKRQTVYKAIHKLLMLGIVTQKGSTIANKYCFIKNYALWKPLPKKVRGTQIGSKRTQKGSKWNPNRVLQKKKENIQKKEPASQDDAMVTSVIKAFEVVDPKNKGYYGNTTQRKACGFLIEEYGLEEVLKRVGVLPRTNKVPYFPSITTPHQLKEKWVQLQDRVQQKRTELQAKKVKVI